MDIYIILLIRSTPSALRTSSYVLSVKIEQSAPYRCIVVWPSPGLKDQAVSWQSLSRSLSLTANSIVYSNLPRE